MKVIARPRAETRLTGSSSRPRLCPGGRAALGSDSDALLVTGGRLCPDNDVLETNGLTQRFGRVMAKERRPAVGDERKHRTKPILIEHELLFPQCRRDRP